MRTDLAFLPDEDSFGLGASIRRYSVLSYQDAGLTRGVADEKVVEHARRHRAIIVSRNRRDFRLAMRDAAAASSSGDCQAMHCREGGGLVTVHRDVDSFHFERVTRALTLNGVPIDWDDVFLLNLHVHVLPHDAVEVALLPQCGRCLMRHVPDCERCQALGLLTLYERQFGLPN